MIRRSAAIVLLVLGAGSRPSHARALAYPIAEPPPSPTPTIPARDGLAPPGAGAVEVLPGVRVDRAKKTVEFDGEVPIDAHDTNAPRVYLEVVVCRRDSKDHEALVVTDVLASHVHAALLLAGGVPGKPGRVSVVAAGPGDGAAGPSATTTGTPKTRLEVVPPSGSRIEVVLVTRGETGAEICSDAGDWIVNATTGSTLAQTEAESSGAVPDAQDTEHAGGADHAPNPEAATRRGWVFAGSKLIRRGGEERGEVYDADGTGLVVGLATFGGECVAAARVFSPEAALVEPVWIARRERVPPARTKVTVRLRVLTAE
ncbi:MAG: hypothetical protein JNM07_00355 [Phycisphaerae bacterium]|nr:hypothetical protein [Phycisphaerae bacterium]